MVVRQNSQDQLEGKSRKYSTIKYALNIFEGAYILLLLVVFVFSGFSVYLAKCVTLIFPAGYLSIAVFFLIIYAVYYILSFPLNFYHNFILEHQFQLTRQSVKDWFLDQIKAGIIFCIISLVMLEVFYALLVRQPQDWWWITSLCWIFLNLLLAKLAPVLIIPLFLKYKKISDEVLRQRILKLAGAMNVGIIDVFEIDLSSKTEKANAGLVGFGNTRRVILGDTLKNKYGPEEIEVILAHEFAHQKLQHLLKLVLTNALTIVFCLYFIYKTSFSALKFFGLGNLFDISAMPVIFIYLVVLGGIFQPWENFLSRKFESEADRLAIRSTGLKDAFISTMEKLAAQNLADRNPHFLIKFFFFDHPAIADRINLARSL